MSWTDRSWTDRRNAALRKAERLRRQLIAGQSPEHQAGALAAAVGGLARAPAPVAPAHPGTPRRARARPASRQLGDETTSESLFGGAPQASQGGGG